MTETDKVDKAKFIRIIRDKDGNIIEVEDVPSFERKNESEDGTISISERFRKNISDTK